jgi:hypothetical protein
MTAKDGWEARRSFALEAAAIEAEDECESGGEPPHSEKKQFLARRMRA